MPRKKSTNPAAILSVSLPLTTRSKIDKFNPRNRSQFFNEAVLQYINRNDRDAIQIRMDEEANLNVENPRIEQASPARLIDVLLRSDIKEQWNSNNINPVRLEALSDLLNLLLVLRGD